MGAKDRHKTAGIFELTEWVTRGRCALEACRYEEARQAYARALLLEPESVEVLRGLGYALFQLRQLADALGMLERALRIDPSDLLARLLMGRLCVRLQQPAGAIEHFQVILQRIGNSAAARSGLIDAHIALGQMDEAEALCADILKAQPHAEVGHLAAARLAGLKGDDEGALHRFEALVQMRPDSVAHRYNRGLCLLRMGRFEEGWRDYEFRFAAGAVDLRMPSTPRWDGRRVQRLLVIAEQGLGDAILFSRFVADAASRASHVTLICPDSLVGLLGRSLGCTCISDRATAWPQHDAHVPLMSLPFVLELGAAAATSRPAYLSADPACRERWAAQLGPRARGALRIGIVHATSAAHSTEENPWTRRSCRAEDLLAIVQAPGIEAFNLNLGQPAEQARAALAGLREMPHAIRDFDDTAAAVGLLDAIVSVDTAGAHLAGALSVPVLLLLPAVPDWRWQAKSSQPACYASVKPFRCAAPGDWTTAVGGVLAACGQLAANGR
jgi:Tfp pilus assembly protein PilF